MENELKTTQDSKMCIKRLEEGQLIMSEASKIIVRNLEVLNELYKEVERLKSKVDRLGELDVIKDNDIKELKGRIEKLETSYIPTEEKQEKWIVHRTLRKTGMETYIVDGIYVGFKKYFLGQYKGDDLYGYHYKRLASQFTKEEAILIRDLLNETRKGKQYLWVVSKVEG